MHARYIPATDKILNKAPILRHIANLLLSRVRGSQIVLNYVQAGPLGSTD